MAPISRGDSVTKKAMMMALVFLGIASGQTRPSRTPTPKSETPHLRFVKEYVRELIDECGQTAMHGTIVFYAVPDENFLEGRTQVYEALRQRVATVFDAFNHHSTPKFVYWTPLPKLSYAASVVHVPTSSF